MHSPNWKHICLNRELKWDYVYQVFMAKSTFLSPFYHVTFGVLYKRSCSGLLYVIKVYLGILQRLAHTFSMGVSRFCVLAVCMCCTVCVSLCVSASLLLLLLLVFRSARLYLCATKLYTLLYCTCFSLTSRSEHLGLQLTIVFID